MSTLRDQSEDPTLVSNGTFDGSYMPKKPFPPGSDIIIYSHSLPPWVDGVATRFTAHTKMLRKQGYRVHLLTMEENLDDDLRRAATSITLLDAKPLYWYPAKRFPIQSLSNLWRVWKTCCSVKPSIIHATLCPSLPLFFLTACFRNVPIVVSVHTDSVTLLDKCGQPSWVVRLVKILEPVSCWLCDATYTVSPSYSQILKQRGVKCLDVTWGGFSDPVKFHPHRLDDKPEKRAAWRKKLTFGAKSAFIMAYAGRISPEKDIDFLLALQQRFKSRGVWIALLGHGPAADVYSPLHGPEHQVYFEPGFLNHDDLADVFASVDCMASASTFETFGFSALEALCTGTPVLAPRAQGLRDVVKHNTGGYLFDAKDLDSAAHYLELLINQKEELFPRDAVFASTSEFTASKCTARTLVAYSMASEARAAALNDGSLGVRLAKRAGRMVTGLLMLLLMIAFYLILTIPEVLSQLKALCTKSSSHAKLRATSTKEA